MLLTCSLHKITGALSCDYRLQVNEIIEKKEVGPRSQPRA